MTPLEFAEVVKTVVSYWGWYAGHSFDTTMQDLIRRKFDDWNGDDLLRALVQAKRHDIKSREPPWDMIYATRKRDSRPRRHDFRILLDNVRRGNRKHGSGNWSDGETFEHHLMLQTYSMLTNAVTHEPRSDPDGRLARMAKRWRDAEYGMWRQYLTDIGEPVPDFLKEPV